MTSTLMSDESIELFKNKIEEYEDSITYTDGMTADEDLEWLEGHSSGLWAAVRILKEMVKNGEIT